MIGSNCGTGGTRVSSTLVSCMSEHLTLGELIGVLKQRDRFMLDAGRYVTVCAFVAGASRAEPDLLDGFQEFVGVERENFAAAWPTSVLSDSLERSEIAQLLEGGGTATLNAGAIGALLDALEEFAHVVENKTVGDFKRRYRDASNQH